MSYEERTRRESNAGPGLSRAEDLKLSRRQRQVLLNALLAYAPWCGPDGPADSEVDALLAALKGGG